MPVDPGGTPPVGGGGGSPDTAAQILTKLKTVDTDTSGLNANFLQGLLPQEVADLYPGETAAAILAKLLTVDTDSSGLNAQFLQGLEPGDLGGGGGGGGGSIVAVTGTNPSGHGNVDVWDVVVEVQVPAAAGDKLFALWTGTQGSASGYVTAGFKFAAQDESFLDANVSANGDSNQIAAQWLYTVQAEDVVDGEVTVAAVALGHNIDQAVLAATLTVQNLGGSGLELLLVGGVKSFGSDVVSPDASVPGVSQDVWALLPDTPEVVLTGVAVGDLIEVAFLIPAAGANDRATTWYDAASIVADAPVSSWLLDAAVTDGVRATGSRVLYDTGDVVTGLGRHVVIAEDLDGDELTLRLIYTTDHATFAAATTATQDGYSSMRIDAVNYGQVGGAPASALNAINVVGSSDGSFGTDWEVVATVDMPAAVGDLIEVNLNTLWGGTGQTGRMDLRTSVGGTPVRNASGDNDGWLGWAGLTGDLRTVNGPAWMILDANDIDGGVVTLEVVGRSDGTRDFATAPRALFKNLGPA